MGELIYGYSSFVSHGVGVESNVVENVSFGSTVGVSSVVSNSSVGVLEFEDSGGVFVSRYSIPSET